MKLLKNILLPLGLYILSNLAYANTTSVVKHFPETLDKNCKDGLAKLYDECGDQSKVLNSAINLAKKENKTVLIVYGAEWCIWCHVFDKYIKGEIGSYEYKWRLEKDGELVK